MPKLNVWKTAAKRIYDGNNIYACKAISESDGYCITKYYNSNKSNRFHETFEPTSEHRLESDVVDWWEYPFKHNNEIQGCRICALLLMGEVETEDEI